MAGQSMIMGDAFGKAYQYGKRKVSAMSNDDFNKMDAKQLGQELTQDYKAIIPSLTEAVKSSSDFQNTVLKEMLSIPGDLLAGLTQQFGSTAPPTTSQTQTLTSASDYGTTQEIRYDSQTLHDETAKDQVHDDLENLGEELTDFINEGFRSDADEQAARDAAAKKAALAQKNKEIAARNAERLRIANENQAKQNAVNIQRTQRQQAAMPASAHAAIKKFTAKMETAARNANALKIKARTSKLGGRSGHRVAQTLTAQSKVQSNLAARYAKDIAAIYARYRT